MNRKRVVYSEAAGVVFVYALATLLHFVYPLSGGSTLSILFGAVNESVWEHVKIFACAYTAYALIQLLWLRVPFRRYVVAKTAGVYLLSAMIIGGYYAMNSLFGEVHAGVHVLSSLFMVILAQGISCFLILWSRDTSEWYYPSLCLLMLYFLMFFSFTVFPPKIDLFRDPRNGIFGIIENSVDTGAYLLSANIKKL